MHHDTSLIDIIAVGLASMKKFKVLNFKKCKKERLNPTKSPIIMAQNASKSVIK